MKRFLALAVILLAVMPLNAQRRDSVYTASEQFKVTKLIAPVSLMGVGAICAFTPAYQNGVNIPVRDAVVSVTGGADLKFDNFLQYAPLAAYGISALCGAGEHGFWEQALTGGTAFILMMASVQAVKFATNNPRPNGNPRSFPSGHTATAFMGAELVRLEYGPWWGLAAYSVACVTGFMRVWNNWHWTSDVVAGAGLGILSAQAAYWLLPLERKLFRLDSKVPERTQLSAVPFAAPTPVGSCYGMTLALSF